VNAAEIAHQSALDRVSALAREVERLRAKQFPIESAKRLLAAIATHVEQLHDDVEELGGADYLSKEELCLAIQGTSSPVLFLHQLLHYLDKIDSPRLPFELILGFEELTTELAGIRTHILLKPDRLYNYYTLVMSDYARKGSRVATKLAEALPGLVIVGFPSAEADSTLLHTLLFHEIGHVVYRRRMANEVQELIEATQTAFASPDHVETLFRWTEEVCCDLIAFRLVGPSFWFAFQWYSVALLERASDSDSHPDLGTRSDLMTAYHSKLCADLPEIESLTNAFVSDGVLERLPVLNTTSPNRVSLVLSDPEYRRRLFEIIEQHVPCPLGTTGMTDRVKHACASIDQFIPPGSSLNSATYASCSPDELLALIFSSAWLYRVTHFTKWDRYAWEPEKKSRVLSELTLAAVEGAILVREYARKSNR
jgi:hypothetical protein